jgi:hypothetical protein
MLKVNFCKMGKALTCKLPVTSHLEQWHSKINASLPNNKQYNHTMHNDRPQCDILNRKSRLKGTLEQCVLGTNAGKQQP